MKVEIKISAEINETYVAIYSNSMSDEVRNIAAVLESVGTAVITVKNNDCSVLLQPQDIFMVTVENDKTVVHCKQKKYYSTKRLYEMEAQLGSGFIRISKSTIVNLKEIYSVEQSFSGMMLLTMKNDCKDYISRKYLPIFKKQIGL